MEDALKKYPPYKEAIEWIVTRFETEGYGIIITDEEFDQAMSIPVPSGTMSYGQFKALEMERLQRYKAIELLLSEHNICLIRSKAQPGFEILPPKDQIRIAYDKRMQKVRRELSKAVLALGNVNSELLSLDENEERERKLMRAAFVRGALNKRQIKMLKS